MSKRRTFRIPIDTGILDHHHQIGRAIWMYLWCIDRTTVEYTNADGLRFGKVLGGKPITDEEVSREISGCSPKVVRSYRLRLVRGGYLTQTRAPYGCVLEVCKSKKWLRSKNQSELPERVNLPVERITQTGRENYPNGSRELPKRVNVIKTRQRQYKTSHQINGAEEQKVFDVDVTSLSITDSNLNALGIFRLPGEFEAFVELVASVRPRSAETAAHWGSRLIQECVRKKLRYPKALLKEVKEAERSGSKEPLIEKRPTDWKLGLRIKRAILRSLDKRDQKTAYGMLERFKTGENPTAEELVELAAIESRTARDESLPIPGSNPSVEHKENGARN